ncbi:MAG: glycosyltransferase [Gemmatimonadales bacterium]
MTAPTERADASGAGFLAPSTGPLDLSRSTFPPPLRAPGTFTVLDITKYFGETTGGIRTYLLAKARYIQSRPELRHLLVVPGAQDALAEEQGVRCYRLRGPRVPFDQSYRFLLATRTTRRILDHERPDLIEVGSPWVVPWVTRRANRGLQAPLAWFYHTHFPGIIAPELPTTSAVRRAAGQLAWKYVRRLSRIFRGVLVASDTVGRALEHEGVDRVHRVALGVDLSRFHPARRTQAADVRRRLGLPDAPLALYLGRFAGEKQLETVLAAWREVERRTGAWLILVGQGPREARLRALAEGLQVRWLPYISDRDQVADLLAAIDLYLSPGPAETFGLSAIEAMASGAPVLSVDAGAVAERVRLSGAGALYAPGDSGAFAEAAITLLRGDLHRLGQTARGYAELHHDWRTAFEGIVRVYRQLSQAPG